MLARLSTLAFALPLVTALTIDPLTNAASEGVVTVTWTATTTDPAFFSLELVNAAFHNTFAIANNVETALGTLTVQLPELPSGDGYNIEAIAPNDINTVYSESGAFSVGPVSSGTTSAASTASSASTPVVSSATISTASTPTPTVTTPVSSVTPIVITTSSSTTASSTPSSFSSNGAAPLKMAGIVPAAALVLSAVAGAALVF